MFATLALILSTAQVGAPAPVAPAAGSRGPHTAVLTSDSRPAAALDARITRADSLSFAGKLGDAENLYHRVIDEQTESGRYAKDALWHLAMAYDLIENQAKTARTLDRLADDAATFGDPQMELEASFESARLHALLHDPRGAAPRAARVHCLLQSPVIPEAVKAKYQARIVDEPAQK